MGSTFDDAKGRMKEAAGALTDDDSMKNEGKADRAGGKVKEMGEKVKDGVADAVDAVKDKSRSDR